MFWPQIQKGSERLGSTVLVIGDPSPGAGIFTSLTFLAFLRNGVMVGILGFLAQPKD